MSKLQMTELAAALTLTLVVAGVAGAQAPIIFSDKFETGIAGAVVAAPWGKNDITQSTYQSATNPFPSGAIYADLTDPGTGTAPSQAVRLMSAANSATDPLVHDQITSFSFDFWEPNRAGDTGAMIAGYYREQANVDLNSGGRNYTATLHDGTLSPQSLVSGSGAATTYSQETVNTLWIVANDTNAASAVYSGTHAVAPLTADVWISKGGAAPEYVFSVNKQNPGAYNGTTITPMVGVGFRTVNADIERMLVDNVLLQSGATLDRSLITFKAGDVNGDTLVNMDDFTIIRDHFQQSVASRSLGDLNADGKVEFRDFRQWKDNFAGVLPANAWIPEPSALAIALVAVSAGAVQRRKQRAARA